MEVFINDRQELIEIDESMNEIILKVVEEALNVEGIGLNYEVSVSFVDNVEIKELNKEYRGIDRETDVLSFPMDEDFPMPVPMLGDIIISTDKAVEQAKEFNHSIEREIGYLTAHSMFHLMGYDHMEDDEKRIMRGKEDKVMDNLGITRNYKGD